MPRLTTPGKLYVAAVLIVVLSAVVALLLNVLAGRTDLTQMLGRYGLDSWQRLGSAAAVIIVLVVLVTIYQLRSARPAGPVDFSEAYLQQQRRQMLQNLDATVEDLLNLFPYNVRRIHVRLEIMQGAVETLLPAGETGLERHPVPARTRITAVFDAHARGMLLILGAPRSGKTTLLLELAQDLLGRAKQDLSHRIPVLFFLSRWTPSSADLTQWLAGELKEIYKVPPPLADYWITNDQILPLLDGLDEVAADDRQACLQVINDFRDNHGLVPLAVCSRLQDYRRMPQQLQLSRAVVIQPLTENEIREYLRTAQHSDAGLSDIFENDPTLLELLDTPLWLGFMMRALEAPGEWQALETGSLEQRRHRILSRCVDAMLSRYKPDEALAKRAAGRVARNVRSIFRRQRPEEWYAPEDVLHWLSWLASSMLRLNRIPFYLEDLGLASLPSPSRTTAILGARLAFGLTFGLIGSLIGGLSATVYAGPFYGSIGYLIGAAGGAWVGMWVPFSEEKPADKLSWSLRETWPLLVTMVFGFPVIGLAFWLASRWLGGYAFGLEGSLVMGLCSGLVFSLAFAFVPRQIPVRTRPNQGTAQSGLNGLSLGLGIGLLLGLLAALFRTTVLGLGHFLTAFLSGGLTAGLLLFLCRGGGFFLSHWFIRLILRFYGYAPLRYVRFLEYATGRLFLKRAGSGYLFFHRVLMEYFVSDAVVGQVAAEGQSYRQHL